jgi:CheY-like chemotaxis protein
MNAEKNGNAAKKAILLAVDDSPANLELLKGLFEDEFDVRLAKSGAAAMNALARFSPDIVLLDVMMHGMSGFDVMKIMKKDTNMGNIPIVIITSDSSGETAAKADEFGADGFIAKPYRVDDLRAAINAALNSRRLV